MEPYKVKCTPYMCYYCSRFQISVSFALRPDIFELQVILKKSAPNDPKLTLNPTRSTVPRICVTSIHESQISVRFALWPAVLRYRPFWKRYTEWPKNNLEPYKVKLPHTRYMCYWYPWLPNFTPFRSMTSRFRDTGYFETSAPNDLKKTLNPTRLKVPHMCIISIAEYQISSHFPLRPTEIPSWR